MNKLWIAHIYPRDMNIYGDIGNIIVLKKRLELRGFSVDIQKIEVDDKFDTTKADIVFGGGGQDSGQLIVGDDLIKKASILHRLIEDGVPMLVICGMYQLFGHGFVINDQHTVRGIDVFDANTIAGSTRMIGNIVIESTFGKMVGFENHSGQTVLGQGQQPLGMVTQGFGNNTDSRQEGAVTKSVYGSYMHGPLLPKNPRFADHLISIALKNKFGISKLDPLDDELELNANAVAISRPR